MPTTVVGGAAGAVVAVGAEPSAGVAGVEAASGRGVCITVVKSVPVTSVRWFAGSVASGHFAAAAGVLR